MTDRFTGTWTLRGVFDVDHDIFLLPGDKVVISRSGVDYKLDVIEGARKWGAVLRKLNPGNGTVGDQLLDGSKVSQARNSRDMSPPKSGTGKSRHLVEVETEYAKRDSNRHTHLDGVSTELSAKVQVFVGYDAASTREFMVIDLDHATGNQNGTGHGDRPD